MIYFFLKLPRYHESIVVVEEKKVRNYDLVNFSCSKVLLQKKYVTNDHDN